MDFFLTFFVAIVVISVLGIFLLYRLKNYRSKNYIYYFLIVWSVLLVYINITSLPSNYILQRIVSGVFLVPSIISIFINFKNSDNKDISYKLVILSILLSLIDLFI